MKSRLLLGFFFLFGLFGLMGCDWLSDGSTTTTFSTSTSTTSTSTTSSSTTSTSSTTPSGTTWTTETTTSTSISSDTNTSDTTSTTTPEAPSYSLDFEVFGGVELESLSLREGDPIVLPVPNRMGHTFIGWFLDEGAYETPFVVTVMPSEDITLYAKWSIDHHSVIYLDHDGEILLTIDLEYGADLSECPLPEDPSRTGYRFLGWDGNLPDRLGVEDILIYAQYEINRYSIQFDFHDGTVIDPIIQDYGTSILRPEDPSWEGHQFIGWFADSARTEPFDFGAFLTEDTTIHAKWTVDQHAVSFVDHDRTVLWTSLFDFGSDLSDLVAPEDPVRLGYTFTGWSQNIPTVMGTEEVVLTARYSVNQYTIWLARNDGSSVESVTQDYGSSLETPENPIWTGHTFLGWFSDPEMTQPFSFTTMPAEYLTVFAKWSIDRHTVTYVDHDGAVLMALSFDYGADLSELSTPPSPMREGHAFVQWDGNVPATMGTEDLVLTAQYAVLTYLLEFRDADGTLLQTSAHDYGSDLSAVPRPAVSPQTGYGFSGWSPEVPATMGAANLTLTATYSRNRYTVSFQSNGGSPVSPITQEYESTLVEPEEPTKAGYAFDGWFLDAAFTETYVFSTVPAYDLVLYASWLVVYPEDDPVNYTFVLKSDDTYEVTKFVGTKTSLVVPSSYLGKPVTSIAAGAFLNCTKVTSVILPKSIQSIGASVFRGCGSLKNLTVPFIGASRSATGETGVLGYWFGTSSYTGGWDVPQPVAPDQWVTFVIPTSLNTIKITDATQLTFGAFYNCYLLTSISLPETLVSLDSSAFYGCKALTAFTVHRNNPAFCAQDGILWNKAMTRILSYPAKRAAESFTVPEGVTAIDDYVFGFAVNLKQLHLPSSVTAIGDYAFYGSDLSLGVTFAEGSQLREVGDYAFIGTQMTSFTFPASLVDIQLVSFGGSAFTSYFVDEENPVFSAVDGVLMDKDQSTILDYPSARPASSYVFPASVTAIGEGAFSGIRWKNLVLPDTIVTIGKSSFANCYQLESVTIGAGVTHIGELAFDHCSVLTSVTFAQGSRLTVLGTKAFSFCDDLKTLDFSPCSQLDVVGDQAFQYCYALETLILPASITSIGKTILEECMKLVNLTVPFLGGSRQSTGKDALLGAFFGQYAYQLQVGTIQYYSDTEWVRFFIPLTLRSVTVLDADTIEYGAFSRCDRLTAISFGMDGGLEVIGSKAFWNCTNLTSLVLSPGVTMIGNDILSGCGSLTSLTLPFVGKSPSATGSEGVMGYLFGTTAYDGSVAVNQTHGISAYTTYQFPASLRSVTLVGTTRLGYGAFSKCEQLTSVTLPDDLTVIGDEAFSGCYGLVSLGLGANTQLTSIGRAAFQGCMGLTSFTIPSALTTLGPLAFMDCTGLTAIHVSAGNLAFASVDGVLFNPQKTEILLFPSAKGAATYVIPNGVTRIGDRAFRACYDLTGVTFPATLTEIGEAAFQSSGLQTLSLPAGVSAIGNNAFDNCWNLQSVTFAPGSQLRTIGDYGFSGCSNLPGITFPGSLISIGVNAFSECRAFTSLTIPAGIREIGGAAFSNCTNLSSVVFASGSHLTVLSSSLFSSCSKLTGIVIPSGIVTIGSYAFSYCSDLANVTFASGSHLESIGDWAFSNTYDLYQVTFPASVKTIGDAVFYQSGLVIVNFQTGSQLTSIGVMAFNGFVGLNEITIPAGVTYIGAYAITSEYSSTKIYTPLTSQPSGWDPNWNPNHCVVHWGTSS